MADPELLARLLILASLIGASIEYSQIVRRRAMARRADSERRAASAAGLRGLVRVFLVEPQRR